MKEGMDMTQPIVLFDGVCNLCNGAVQFILAHNEAETIQFASLQSDIGQQLLAHYGVSPEVDSLVLLKDGEAFLYSDAALKIAQQLTFPYRFLGTIGLLVPRPIRNIAYRIIAKYRYRLFGKNDACRLGTPEEMARFITSKQND